MGASQSSEEGSLTAEFAIVLPAVLMVLILVVASIELATERLTLSSAAAEISRLEARGDNQAAAEVLSRLSGISGVQVRRGVEGVLWCVMLSANPAGGLLGAIEISARGCAVMTGAGDGGA